jgi:hypothetical protein
MGSAGLGLQAESHVLSWMINWWRLCGWLCGYREGRCHTAGSESREKNLNIDTRWIVDIMGSRDIPTAEYRGILRDPE